MNKISYNSTILTDKNKPLRGPQPPEDSSMVELGGRGFTANEITSDYDLTTSSAEEPAPTDLVGNEDTSYQNVIDLLVELGDDMDIQNNEVLANFSDFLIKKFSAINPEDYTKKYNELMIKINAADLPNTNEIIKKLTKIFSRTILLEFQNKKSLSNAKESAYKKVLHRAEQYLSEG